MKAISAYMANRSRDGDRGNEYDSQGRRDARNEYGGAESRVYNARQPNQYTRRSAMDEDRPEGNEMRRRRDDRGRYMTGDYTGPESSYRGRDGRYKSGTRRSEYDGDAYDNYPTDRRMEDDDEDEEEEGTQANVIQWPYSPDPDMRPENRVIGFATRDREYQTRSHYDGGRQAAEVGGTMWMQPVDHHGDMEMNKETAEKWMRSMRNEDNARPTGARWKMDELKPMAEKFGIKPDTEEFYEFAVMTNAMYSDYCGVAKKFNITSPEFYGMLAVAWMRDKDAVPNKTAMYYNYIVKK